MTQTNAQFAEKVGIHFSMASRLRNGKRLPSASLIFRISYAYQLPIQQIQEAYLDGPDEFGRYLRENVFDAESTS